MNWISTQVRLPKEGVRIITACRNKNMRDCGIWLYDLCYYFSDTGFDGRDNWEDVLYWSYIEEPKE